jgi:hypothetical protein
LTPFFFVKAVSYPSPENVYLPTNLEVIAVNTSSLVSVSLSGRQNFPVGKLAYFNTSAANLQRYKRFVSTFVVDKMLFFIVLGRPMMDVCYPPGAGVVTLVI